ncbi:MAG: RimK/LysX family protein [Acidobacteriota bacterium]
MKLATSTLVLAIFCWLWPCDFDSVLAASRSKDIFGWLEKVEVGESRLVLEAKLDTGADTSSLHASKIHRYRQKDGDRWVNFLVVDSLEKVALVDAGEEFTTPPDCSHEVDE